MKRGLGLVRVILAVSGSRATASFTHWCMSTDQVSLGALSFSMFRVKATSFAVNGCPSDQVMPLRSLIVSWVKSSL
jgi:hypothetical protein